jgi:hypothetical protein
MLSKKPNSACDHHRTSIWYYRGNRNDCRVARPISEQTFYSETDEVAAYYFNGQDTVTQLAIDQKLGGVMIWELSQDTIDESRLLRALKAALAQQN